MVVGAGLAGTDRDLPETEGIERIGRGEGGAGIGGDAGAGDWADEAHGCGIGRGQCGAWHWPVAIYRDSKTRKRKADAGDVLQVGPTTWLPYMSWTFRVWELVRNRKKVPSDGQE